MIRPTMSHALNKDDLHELMSKYASHLEDELAKANERVEELEGRVKGVSGLFNDAVDTCYEMKTARDKFVTEKKVDVLERILAETEELTASYAVKDRIVWYIKQLRKEQE